MSAPSPGIDWTDPERVWRDFGTYLKTLREVDRKLDRRTLERQADVAYQTIATLEGGGRTERGRWNLPNPEDRVLAKIAAALGVPPERFFERVGRQADRPSKPRRAGAGRQPTEDDVWEAIERLRERVEELEAEQARTHAAAPPQPGRGRSRRAG
jgi:transcriptional regulator with XRE-family HTH domain